MHELQRHGPTQAQKSLCLTTQLRRYLLEIIALTFDASFDLLNSMLYDDDSIIHTNSILSDAERVDFAHLSRLVRNASQMRVATNQVEDLERKKLQ